MGKSAPDGPGDEQVCANCGNAIETESWHPVIAGTDASGAFRLYPFCSPRCRDVWNRTQTTEHRE